MLDYELKAYPPASNIHEIGPNWETDSTHNFQEKEGYRSLAPQQRSKRLQGAMAVQQALACLRSDLGGLVYPDLGHQGFRLGIGLGHL